MNKIVYHNVQLFITGQATVDFEMWWGLEKALFEII